MITQVFWCELDKNRNLMWSKTGKACLILIFSANTNCESMAYRSFRSEEYSAGVVRKSYHRDSQLGRSLNVSAGATPTLPAQTQPAPQQITEIRLVSVKLKFRSYLLSLLLDPPRSARPATSLSQVLQARSRGWKWRPTLTKSQWVRLLGPRERGHEAEVEAF